MKNVRLRRKNNLFIATFLRYDIFMKAQKGNALFLILIAVALFAALSYAVTNSGRGGSGIDREQAELQISQILQYGASIKTAIMRMKITSGCSDTQISFHYDSDGDGALETDGSDDYYNPNANGLTECYVFHTDGGGLSFELPPADFFSVTGLPKWGEQYSFVGTDCVPDVGTGAGSICYNNGTIDDTELNMVLVGINDEMCQALNARVGYDGDIPTMSDSWGNFYDTTFITGSFKGVYGTSATGSSHLVTVEASTSGQPTSCFLDLTANANIVYYSLLER